jgi:hypothetical protein
MWKGFLIVSLLSVIGLSGCEKVSNTAKNIQSDWVGLDRVVEIRSCLDGRLIKRYKGSIRLNPEDKYGASLLVNGKKLHTNMCYIIQEVGIKEEPLPMTSGVVR